MHSHRRSDHQLTEAQIAQLRSETRTKEEFLASIRAPDGVKLELEPQRAEIESKLKKSWKSSSTCSVRAMRTSSGRMRSLDPEPAEAREAREDQRQKNRDAAVEVKPPQPDSSFPRANKKGAIVMPTQRCTADGRDGKQCKGRTRKGQYCFTHRKKLNGTRIAQAQKKEAGMGLYATRDFKVGEFIAAYSGELVNGGANTGGPYYLQLRRAGNECIDAARTNSGDGRWVNDPRGSGKRANCEFAMRSGTTKVRVRATRAIKAGDEFLLSYGRAYWRCLQQAKKHGGVAKNGDNRRKANAAPSAEPQLLAAAELSALTLARGDYEIIAETRAAAEKDENYQARLKKLPTGHEARDGLLWLGTRLVVPNELALRTKLIAEMHDTPTGGHFGRDKTLAALKKRFHWEGMATTTAAYVAGCDMCQRVKHSQQLMPGLLMPLPVPEEIDSHWTMDFVTGLPKTARGHDTIQGHFSRGGSLKRLAATDTTVDAARAADTFLDSVVRHHGVPVSIVSR